MACIRRGTTPVVSFVLAHDISACPTIQLTAESAGQEYTFDQERLEVIELPDEIELPFGGKGCILRVELTQDETLALCSRCRFQVRALTEGGKAISTVVISARVAEAINEEVL